MSVQGQLTKTVFLAGAATTALLLSACDKKQDTAPDQAGGTAAIQEVKITILDHACDPMELAVDAGKVRFLIHNQSNRAVEWEILKGIRIIDERENIPPGFTQKLTTTLDPDTYEMTCGLLSNPRGALTVRATSDTDINRKPTPMEMVTAAGEYRVYLNTEINALQRQSQALADAIKAGDLAGAQKLYAPTMQHYEHIEPVLKQFSTLDVSVAADESIFRDRAQDPEFRGFHRIERGLFADQSTEGLAAYADRLLQDIQALKQEVAAFKITPAQIITFETTLIREINQSKLEGQKNLYAKTDLWGMQANLDGSLRIFRLVRPLISKAHPELAKQIEDQYTSIQAILDTYRTADGFKPYGDLTEADKTQLKSLLTQLEDNLTSLPATLGLE